MHYGEPNSLSDGFGGFVDERAEVALLDRNIVVMGTKEDEPYNLEGTVSHKLKLILVFMVRFPYPKVATLWCL